MRITIDPERLAKIEAKPLAKGSHTGITDGFCIMEAVAYIAREKWSDAPVCACPVISAFLRAWNDGLPDYERDELLRPLIVRLVGTKGSEALEHRRSLMAADWLVREHTPTWLRLAGLTTQADALASLPEITDMAQVPSIRAPIEAARRDANAAWAAAWDAARAAAWDAAWDAAGDAAGAAARAAAWAAAWDAARAAVGGAARAAAWDAAGAAARAAAWAAAWDAARAAVGGAAGGAAGDALKPTRDALKLSALALVNRMIDARDAA